MALQIPFITVVIPAFNAERYITQAIDSVFRQTYGTFEVIVVDDGSTDRTRSVIERYGPVRYEYQRNAGPSSARNRAIELATGDLVAFLDADDVWHPEKCAVQMARFNERPELVGCATHVQNFLSDDAGDVTTTHEHSVMQQTVVTLGTTLMVRRSLFDAVGTLNPQYWHRDLQDLLVRAEDRGFEIEILPDVLAQRRIHSTNMSNSRSGADHLELISITRARHARRRAAGV
jgi:glycosyltransferase involved in cell wall biosynthesis